MERKQGRKKGRKKKERKLKLLFESSLFMPIASKYFSSNGLVFLYDIFMKQV
jgi:hypothetical protein